MEKSSDIKPAFGKVMLEIGNLEHGGHSFKIDGDPMETCSKMEVLFEAGSTVAKIKMEFYAGVNAEIDAEIESIIAKKVKAVG